MLFSCQITQLGIASLWNSPVALLKRRCEKVVYQITQEAVVWTSSIALEQESISTEAYTVSGQLSKFVKEDVQE